MIPLILEKPPPKVAHAASKLYALDFEFEFWYGHPFLHSSELYTDVTSLGLDRSGVCYPYFLYDMPGL
jgi:hypothetical protein